jgi:NADH-quinone oxidoreductase subunit I
MGGLLNKIFLVDLFRTMGHVPESESKYIYTEQYPTERPKVAERYRGRHGSISIPTLMKPLHPCNLCAGLSENLIVVTSVRNEQTRQRALTALPTTSPLHVLWAL